MKVFLFEEEYFFFLKSAQSTIKLNSREENVEKEES